MELPSDVIVTTSDNKECRMARWQIRESNSLYELFSKQLTDFPDKTPVHITIPTVSHDELHEYSIAQKQKNFDTHQCSIKTCYKPSNILLAVSDPYLTEPLNLFPRAADD